MLRRRLPQVFLPSTARGFGHGTGDTTDFVLDQSAFQPSDDRAACGVSLIVNPPGVGANRTLVERTLACGANYNYRSGINPTTEECDGAGIRLFGLSRSFFAKAFNYSELYSEPQFAIGQYFISNEQDLAAAQRLIQACVVPFGLVVVKWRQPHLNRSAVSDLAWSKKPQLWQALMIPTRRKMPLSRGTMPSFEHKVLRSAIQCMRQIQKERYGMYIVSQSSQSVTYSGMVFADRLADFFGDLTDSDFTAHASSVHARFATNTNPEWDNAQPCTFFISHNGEINSIAANSAEAALELRDRQFLGVMPDRKLSDSKRLDSDIANQIGMYGSSLPEAVLRLLPPPRVPGLTESQKAMLNHFRLKRTPYDGPTFCVSGWNGEYVVKLDSVGLRPSRCAIATDGTFYACSDDCVEEAARRFDVEPGGLVLITSSGEVQRTKEVIATVEARMKERYPTIDFRALSARDTPPWDTPAAAMHGSAAAESAATTTAPSAGVSGAESTLAGSTAATGDALTTATTWSEQAASALHRKLVANFWYREDAEAVQHMALTGQERVAAMGDDTNPLRAGGVPLPFSYFFHQLFAQVSSPPIDSIKERDRFNLRTELGPVGGPQYALESPILPINATLHLQDSTDDDQLPFRVVDITFPRPPPDNRKACESWMEEAIASLQQAAENEVARYSPCVICLSDRNVGPKRVAVPAAFAIAAVRSHLESMNMFYLTSLVIDTYQVSTSHQMAVALSFGARAAYPRGAYEILSAACDEGYPGTASAALSNARDACEAYRVAQEKSLLKTMGKIGVLHFNNYGRGQFCALLGLDNSQGTLGAMFGHLSSTIKGWTAGMCSRVLLQQHSLAFDPTKNMAILKQSGQFMAQRGGDEHGYGPGVVAAFREYFAQEEVRSVMHQIDATLHETTARRYVRDSALFATDAGFLDPTKKVNGFYPTEYLDTMRPSKEFNKMSKAIVAYHEKCPTSLSDYLKLDFGFGAALDELNVDVVPVPADVQSVSSILSQLFSGSMSQGALSTGDLDTPEKLGAHETLTRALNTVGAMSAAGEGGENLQDLWDPLLTDRSKQIASGRFGVSAAQIVNAVEMEIKVAQGAKPGEGGQLPGQKVTVRIASQRGALPGIDLISPPPHHDIYSIEDLAQLIYDLKRVSPKVRVAVKLVASPGIGTIACGVAKAGADTINVAGMSGGTGAATQTAIKHCGMPAEIGLADVDRCLRGGHLRDLVQLRTSGGFKTAEDIVKAAICGADQYELGTTLMITMGCIMQRTCNQSCQPGVTADGHLFKGQQINAERYMVHLATSVQQLLVRFGVRSLRELRGRTDLIRVDPRGERFALQQAIIDRDDLPQPVDDLTLRTVMARRELLFLGPVEDELLKTYAKYKEATFAPPALALTTLDRTFGGRTAGQLARKRRSEPDARVQLTTHGNAGQSYGFCTTEGMSLKHTGIVQDGCGKSLSGGEIAVVCPKDLHTAAHENTVAGNVVGYGCSGGNIFINGRVGHRCGILLKGGTMVVEGLGDFGFEYMTDGTGMVLGTVGRGLGVGASAGVLFLLGAPAMDPALRTATANERPAYEACIRALLSRHVEMTRSHKAQQILNDFMLDHFTIAFPKWMDNLSTPGTAADVVRNYRFRASPISCGMSVWLDQRCTRIVGEALAAGDDKDNARGIQALVSELARIPEDKQCMPAATVRALLKKCAAAGVVPESPEKIKATLLAGRTAPPKEATATPTSPFVPATVEQRLTVGQVDEVLARDAKGVGSLLARELAHLGTGCSGCRAQSCAGANSPIGCPSEKPINSINDELQQIGPIDVSRGLTMRQVVALRKAWQLQVQATPFIAYTGAACPAPCESACTESIADNSHGYNPRREKEYGQPVRIQRIEKLLHTVGVQLGWDRGQLNLLHVPAALRAQYRSAMAPFDSPFRLPPAVKASTETVGGIDIRRSVVIVGSGPAGMQIAFEALRDGFHVRMYEKSNTPGGLLVDGIPWHKYDKSVLDRDFESLRRMGLELHLNSPVECREGQFWANGSVIAQGDDDDTQIVLCVGTGQPRGVDVALPDDATGVIQAVDYLKRANDFAKKLSITPNHEDPKVITKVRAEILGDYDMAGKSVLVVGGGDTAQDAIRWTSRLLEGQGGKLVTLARGPQLEQSRGIADSYPAMSRAQTKENAFQREERTKIGADSHHLVVPKSIERVEKDGKPAYQVTFVQREYVMQDAIAADPKLAKLFRSLPREARQLNGDSSEQVVTVDRVILATGFRSANTLPIVVNSSGMRNVLLAGDASDAEEKIIVGAQSNASRTYLAKIRPAFGLGTATPVTSSRRLPSAAEAV